MTRVVVLGSGISGHTAASFARTWLGRGDEVTVVSPRSDYNWVPSNIWVGVGLMQPSQVTFPLAPVYERKGIEFVLGAATEIHPEGDAASPVPFVDVAMNDGASRRVPYDFLINATGPALRFDMTPGLGPDGGNSQSVCLPDHAVAASAALDEEVARMRKGEKRDFVVGVGHGTCTCEGAAFEYVVNLEFELRNRGVRDRANITWLTNEYELGDFGMGGMYLRRGGYVTPSSIFNESLFAERGIDWVKRAHVAQVNEGSIDYETLDGTSGEMPFDFAMLLPPFSGVGLKAIDRDGADITERVFMPNGFMRVDADYSGKPPEEWHPSDWPRNYQSPDYPNVFAAGIAFAPPHQISIPRKSPNGTLIAPAPPRTGMPSASIGKAVAASIVDMARGATEPTHHASMAEMGAGCVASAGASLTRGTAASMTVFPIVPDFERYPKYGRDEARTFGEIGLAGHWIKLLLHYMFIYKARMRPGWRLIPE